MERDIKNKVVVVTGGADGIGLNIAKKFALEGARRVVILDIDEERGRAAVEEITRSGGVAEFIQGDLAGGGERAFETLAGAYTVDVLVNNAGVPELGNPPSKLLAINLTASIELSLKFSNIMNKQKGGNGGTIINICSVAGYRIFYIRPVYTASKFGLTAFSRSLGHAETYKTSGVRVIALCPGLTNTKMVVGIFNYKGDDENILRMHSRMQSPDAVGDAAVHVFKMADSGTVWAIELGKPVKEVDLEHKET